MNRERTRESDGDQVHLVKDDLCWGEAEGASRALLGEEEQVLDEVKQLSVGITVGRKKDH